MYVNIIKVINKKTTANITFNSEVGSFSTKIRNEIKVLTLITPIQHSTGSLSQSSQTRKRNKGIRIRRE